MSSPSINYQNDLGPSFTERLQLAFRIGRDSASWYFVSRYSLEEREGNNGRRR